MLKKTVLLVLLFTIARFIISCCHCQPSTNYRYTHDSLTICHLDYRTDEMVITTDSTALKNAYGIRLLIDRTVLACKEEPAGSQIIQSTYAFSCGCELDAFIQTDSIVSIKITTLTDFDSLHLKNTDVTSRFYVFKSNAYIPVDMYIKGTRQYEHPSPNNDADVNRLQMSLLLMTPPQFSGIKQFLVEVVLSDGRIFSKTTSTISLI
jgi:hypothetical protein